MVEYEFLQKLISKNGMSELSKIEYIKEEDVGKEESFLNYVLGRTFMKRSYNGYWQMTNQHICDRNEQSKLMHLLGISNYKQLRTELRDLFIMNGMIDAWKKYKQCYVFDPDFIEVLTKTENVQIPISFFRELPFNCFYIDLENCNKFQQFFGCMVYVSVSNDTGVPNIAVMRFSKQSNCSEELIFSAYLLEKYFFNSGMVITKDAPYIDFNKSIVPDIGERSVNILAQAQGAESFVETNTADFVAFIMQAILYLGSYKPDIQRRTYNSNRSKRIAAQLELTESEVGVIYGSKIRISKNTNDTLSVEIEPGSKKINREFRQSKPKRCHVRRAHWHTFRTGKGRKDTIVKWIPPTFICGHSTPVTVHKVMNKN